MDEKTPIRALCEKYEMTQNALAQRFGIPLRTVEDWAVGRRKPPEYVVAMIDQILTAEVPAHWIYHANASQEGNGVYECSHCGNFQDDVTPFLHCPRCGKKIEQEKLAMQHHDAEHGLS